jgi:hypothetical protein
MYRLDPETPETVLKTSKKSQQNNMKSFNNGERVLIMNAKYYMIHSLHIYLPAVLHQLLIRIYKFTHSIFYIVT